MSRALPAGFGTLGSRSTCPRCLAGFAAYVAALGDRFVERVLPDSAANTDVAPFFAVRVRCPHSVVTAHLIDEAGQPTIAARDEILSFFARRLVPHAT
jgi:hypothetical protein